MTRTRIIAGIAAAGLLALTGCSLSPTDSDPALNSLPSGSGDCSLVRVAASSEKATLMARLADEFNEADDNDGDDCTRALVYSHASGSAMKTLADGWTEADGPTPDVWSPASRTWLELLNARGADQVDPEAPSLAATPLVIAMPRPMAEALGWPEEPLGWGDLRDLAADPRGWGAHGHPEWGAFKLGKTNPEFSTSGLSATIGAYYAATGVSSDLLPEQVESQAAADYVSTLESSVVHYGDTTLTFLENMDLADRAGRGLTYVSAVAVEEKSVLDFNAGNPRGDLNLDPSQWRKPTTELAAFYPSDGTPVSDNPYALLSSASPESKAAADAFLTFLTGSRAQEAFADAGFRGSDLEPVARTTPENGALAIVPATLGSPSPQTLTSILSSWKDTRKAARVLMVVDTSGSMGGRRLELAREALLSSYSQFAPQDSVGLAEFNSDFSVLVPVASFTENRDALLRATTDLTDGGGTALYAAAGRAVAEVEALPPANTIDAVVLLSDGENTEGGDLDSLLSSFDRETEPVRVFTIGYGGEADLGELNTLSRAAGASSYDASNPDTIDSVLASVVSNF